MAELVIRKPQQLSFEPPKQNFHSAGYQNQQTATAPKQYGSSVISLTRESAPALPANTHMSVAYALTRPIPKSPARENKRLIIATV